MATRVKCCRACILLTVKSNPFSYSRFDIIPVAFPHNMLSVERAPPQGKHSPRNSPRRAEPSTNSPRSRVGGKPIAASARSVAKNDPPLRINPKRVTFGVLSESRQLVRAGQGRTYWNAQCETPATPGAVRTAKFVFSPWKAGEAAAGAVGMLPPGVCEEELSDWLGFQRESAAVWLDGACRQWGKRLSRVSPALKNAAQEGDTITCCHAGSRLTVSRDGKAIASQRLTQCIHNACISHAHAFINALAELRGKLCVCTGDQDLRWRASQLVLCRRRVWRPSTQLPHACAAQQ